MPVAPGSVCPSMHQCCSLPLFPLFCSFSHDSRYLAIAGEQPVLDVENVETGESLGRLALRYS